MRPRYRAVLAGFASAWLLGCDPKAPATEDPARQAAAIAPADPDLEDALGQAIATSASKSAPAWIKMQKLWRGELQARERRGFLAVLVYGHCYRFIGVGGAGVSDLDLVLLDPNGVETHRDVTQDSTPTLGVDASLCPSDPGAYRVEVRMRTGAGPFAIGLYRDQQ